jgi:hypothetical protein
MDTNRYSVESVIDGVGWLQNGDKRTIREILGEGATISHNQVANQLHLYWDVDADGMEEAIDYGRRNLRVAGAATGVFAPESSYFSVRKITQ